MTYIYVVRRQTVKAGGTYINQCAVTVPRYNTIDFIIQFCAARELNKIGNVSTYKRNMEARSRTHCDRVMSVSVFLLSLYGLQIAFFCAVLHRRLWPVRLYNIFSRIRPVS